MSFAERVSSKSHICPRSFASRPNVHFSDNLSAADIISRHIYQPPEGVYLLNVKTSMISVISSLSLKLDLNSLVYHRNIFGSSSKVFGNLRQSSDIFGHLRKFSEILGKCSGTFVWPSKQFWKIFGNLWKVVGNLRKIIKNAVISMFI